MRADILQVNSKLRNRGRLRKQGRQLRKPCNDKRASDHSGGAGPREPAQRLPQRLQTQEEKGR